MQVHDSFRSLIGVGSGLLPRAVALALVLVASTTSAFTGQTKVYGTQYADNSHFNLNADVEAFSTKLQQLRGGDGRYSSALYLQVVDGGVEVIGGMGSVSPSGRSPRSKYGDRHLACHRRVMWPVRANQQGWMVRMPILGGDVMRSVVTQRFYFRSRTFAIHRMNTRAVDGEARDITVPPAGCCRTRWRG